MVHVAQGCSAATKRALLVIVGLAVGFFYSGSVILARNDKGMDETTGFSQTALRLNDSEATAEAQEGLTGPKGFIEPQLDHSDFSAVTNLADIANANSAAIVGQQVYIAAEGKVVVLDRSTNAVIAEIAMPTGLYLGVLGDKVYVPYDSSVRVIDTKTNTVIKTISVPAGATTMTPSGVKLYLTCRTSDVVAVINTTTDTVSSIIPVGDQPFYGSVLGTRVYISNNSKEEGSVSVIDSVSDTVIATIPLGMEPVLEAFVGNKLYISNKLSGTVSVIDTVSNEVSATIPVGVDPEMLLPLGEKLYVVNRSSDSVMVIDPVSDTVISEIPVGSGPYYLVASGKKIFVGNHGADTVSVIDSDSDTVTATLTVGNRPFYLAASSDKIYVPNAAASFFSIIDINQIEVPELLSFETDSPDGYYPAGKEIVISARFNRNLFDGSTMTVDLNTGDKLTLDQINGELLSGTYRVRSVDAVPDLAVTDIQSASVSDFEGNTRYHYAIPFSGGNFTGENSLIARNLGDAHNISLGKFVSIDVGANPYQISSPFTLNGRQYAYVANQGAESLSVVDIAARKEINTLRVGSEPYGFATASISGTARFFVANTNSHSVSVVDSVLGRVIGTIQAGLKPYYAAALNTRIFVTNGQSNTVSVINAANHSVEATVPVGAYPRGIKVLANEVYVANYGDPYYYSGGNTISVLNGYTLQLTDTIVLPAGSRGPRGVAVAGNRVYVTNYLSANVSVIDASTKEVIATIPVGAGPRGMAVAGSKLYVENFDEGTVSVINLTTNLVTKTVQVGHSPSGITAIGNTLYISNFQDNNLLLLDTKSDTLLRSRDISPFASENPLALSEPAFGESGADALFPDPLLMSPQPGARPFFERLGLGAATGF